LKSPFPALASSSSPHREERMLLLNNACLGQRLPKLA
jgi:hypothetical protein